MNLQNSGFDKNSTYFERSLNSSGIPTVFIHGVGLDHTMWLPQKKYFHFRKSSPESINKLKQFVIVERRY